MMRAKVARTMLLLVVLLGGCASTETKQPQPNVEPPVTTVGFENGSQGYATYQPRTRQDTLPVWIREPTSGNCIRRSRSMLDAVEICTLVDSEKIYPGSSEEWVVSRYYWSLNCDDSLDHLFAIEPVRPDNWRNACVNWWNTEDLLWVAESGTIIYLHVEVTSEGVFVKSPCVRVCVDIGTPAICLWTESLEYHSDTAFLEPLVLFLADMNLDSASQSKVKEIALWHKPSGAPDVYDSWIKADTGSYTDSLSGVRWKQSAWRWVINTADLPLGPNDFRLIALVTLQDGGEAMSWDVNPRDLSFDDHTYDSKGCDMKTYWVKSRQ
ncbi:MAG: hypothetical protein HY093_02080 [Candidatus Liptonbacteria bacterium]|nr:hypothetical protein [Candidatus Liptonbacteria bacterium]